MSRKSIVSAIAAFQNSMAAPVRLLINNIEKVSFVIAIILVGFIVHKRNEGDFGSQDVAILLGFVPFIVTFCYMIADARNEKSE